VRQKTPDFIHNGVELMQNDRTTPTATVLKGAAYYTVPFSGFLRIGGEDCVGFLQRQTTNDLRLAQPGRAVLTVLTTPAARILDVLYVLPEADALGVITLPGGAKSTWHYLQSRIFFMDKVTVADASAEVVQIDLLGSDAMAILEQMGVAPLLQPNQVAAGMFDGASVQALAMEPTFGLGFRMLLPAASLSEIQTFLTQAGAAQLSDEEYSVLRVEAGLPAAEAELVEDYTPLEAGLFAAISSSKGCYTGQEVIARQVTYDKVTQHLCGLRLSRGAQPGERVWAADGSPVGKITSAASSPRFGEIALAVVKRPHHEPGAALQVGETLESAAEGWVAALPFSAD
jgi:folate-binding protein YgfZ